MLTQKNLPLYLHNPVRFMLTLCCPTWYSNPSVTYFYVYKSFKSLLGAMGATMEAAMELILIRKFCSFTIMCHCLDFGPGTNPVKISKILLGFWAGFLAPHRPPTPTKMTSMSCRTFLKLGVPPPGSPPGAKTAPEASSHSFFKK